MPHKPTRFSAAGELLPRRKVLRGLGALAVSAPALSVLGCDSDGRAALANSGAGAAAITTQAGATATKSESGGAASQAGIGVPSSSAGHAGD
ncbi:MAG TPA: hypothetical protein VHZ95_21560, partial [Polyangiales bacterium]|nr:hypothetical protein [Polyangiales bacterium]